jgi:predicted ATPase
MRFQSLSITNFRAITHLELKDLSDTVVIAGPNGCGKSCVFDAIKMFKSAYGDYQPNEWQSMLSEYQINLHRKDSDRSILLQDKTKPLNVKAVICVTDEERAFLRDNAKALLADQSWNEVMPRAESPLVPSVAAKRRAYEGTVSAKVSELLPRLLAELEHDFYHGDVTLGPDGSEFAEPSLVLELIFSMYDSQNVGIIDYHGANRSYARDQVGAINLQVDTTESRLRQHALYNHANKYSNLKTELASSYVRHLIAQAAAPALSPPDSLTETMQELFETFFPGKAFLGPLPNKDGRLSFPVRTATGAQHDIDELSSGEKEVVYGYLRIKNAAPKRSVLLIDEPELHLNPRLIKGLAGFYHKHLGRALGNQVWLVTHSDALIREAVGQQDFSVYHMQPAGQYTGSNQATPVSAGEGVERLVVDLVGDLAAYRPNAKIVLFEGGGDIDFDVRMTCTLFPSFQATVNPISAGSKGRVEQLHGLLEKARQEGHLPAKFYSITDSDGEYGLTSSPTQYRWDVYHIENYLLSPPHILRVLNEVNKATPPLNTENGITTMLRRAAEQTIPSLVSHKLRTHVNGIFMNAFDLGFDPKRQDVARALFEAVERTRTNLQHDELTEQQLADMEKEQREAALSQLQSGEWLKTYRGRDVLRRFVNLAGIGIAYEVFRDLVVARMRDSKYQPAGMAKVIQEVLSED